eukprot:Nitzschia sp. Nitz4//scaffold58_size112336//14927//16933//NITZ4_004017-RA/size112336-augustus-gene-0.16-mRNA-1//-1//CDS//3329554941//4863//frame0
MGTASLLGSSVLALLVPYFVGCYLANSVHPTDVMEFVATATLNVPAAIPKERALAVEIPDNLDVSERCDRSFLRLLDVSSSDADPFESISLMLHRNGEPHACGPAKSDKGFLEELRSQYAYKYGESCPTELDKFQVESLLTSTFHNMVQTCPSVENDGNESEGFLGFCDMGPKKTPILLDHKKLVPVVSTSSGEFSLPCRFHTREGLRITQLSQLKDLVQAPSTTASPPPDCAKVDDGEQTCSFEESTNTSSALERHLYAVPAGRVFMFAPTYVGEIFHLPHVDGADNRTIYLEVLSLDPRVFDVFNFFSKEESKELVSRALAEKRDSHKIKRSSTGASGYNVNSRRTSESGFDTHGKTSMKVKQRCFQTLGFDEYIESHADGLQILRYNVSKAYNSHLDWIEDKSGQLEHDFESGGTGGNRFATILLYMSDLAENDGGETVFPEGWPPEVPIAERVDIKTAIEELRESSYGGVLQHGSWEENLVAKCRTRLATRPHSSRAVLFYSQYPNGQVDPASLHGACPVLSGQKYAANLWVWNTPRQGYPGAPIKEKFRGSQTTPTPVPSGPQAIRATFKNSGKDPSLTNAELYFRDKLWGKLEPHGAGLAVNTYEGHEWTVKVDGKVVETYAIQQKRGLEQTFLM